MKNFSVFYAKSNLQVTIPGNCASSEYSNPEVAQPSGNDTRKLCNLQV